MPHGNICHHNESNVVYQIMTTVTHIYDNPQMLIFLDILIFYILYHESQYKVTKGQNVCVNAVPPPSFLSSFFFFLPSFSVSGFTVIMTPQVWQKEKTWIYGLMKSYLFQLSGQWHLKSTNKKNPWIKSSGLVIM